MNFRAFHDKYGKEIQALGLIFLIVAEMIVFPAPAAYAATYNWTQSSWAGGVSATTALHASNQSGWTNYAAADAGITAGANISESNSGISTSSPVVQSVADIYSSASVSLGLGGAGSIIRSTDAGVTWRNLTPATSNALNDVTCVGATCYAVGASGTIVKSTDTGATWATQTTSTTTNLVSISCADANTCWVANNGATSHTILKTTDGGTTWSPIAVPLATGAMNHIYFSSATNGWISGTTATQGQLLKTTDGGANWTGVTMTISNPVTYYDFSGGLRNSPLNVYFADANIGYAVNYFEASDGATYSNFYYGIYKTTDGGTTWAIVRSSANNLSNFSFVDATHGWVLDGTGLYKTTNGSSFAAVTNPSTSDNLISCYDSTHCSVSYSSAAGIYNTTDGGTTWDAGHASPTAYTNATFFVNSTTGWQVGNTGLIKKTTNAGLTWATQTSGTTTQLTSIACADANNCWIGVSTGMVLHTTDGGTNWSTQTTGMGNIATGSDSMTFLDSTHGYAVGSKSSVGKIGITSDGGTNWNVVSTSTSMSAISCTDSTHCWAIGGYVSGVVYTADGGSTWTYQSIVVGSNVYPHSIYFVPTGTPSSAVGYVTGLNGNVYMTTNGGTSWTSRGGGQLSNYSVGTIKCSSATTCYAATDSTHSLYKTTNGGVTWGALNAGSVGYTWNSSNIFSNGTIVLSSTGGVTWVFAPSYPTAVQTLTSSIYDSGDSGNKVNQLTWDESTAGGTTVQFQIRTSPDNVTWTSYLGPDGTTGTYFSNSASGCTGTGTITCTLSSGISIGDGANDRYYQYKAYLTASSDGTSAPTVDNAIVQYVVNVAPNFDTSFDANGVLVSENATTTSPVGQVLITYKVRDADTTSGSLANRGLVTPSFDYNLNDGTGWHSITSGYLAAGDLDRKAVAEIAYNTYTATWDAATQLGTSVSTTTAQVRVTVNDLEGANNTASATETGVTIDTTPPSVSVHFDGTTNTIYATSTDLMPQSMRISNNADSSADGVNGNSGVWTATSSQISWTPPANRTIYFAVRDQFGNTSTTTIVGVASSTSMNIRDVSNPAETNPRLFTSWSVHTDVAGATFASYKVYRGTSPGTETYLATVSNSAQNYYIDAAVSSTTRYYYKTTVVDTDGDESGFSEEVNGIPNGQGFGTDLVAPIISSVVISNVKATTADVTWSTDELSDSFVDYSVSPSTAFGTTVSSPSFVTSHTISLTGLTPSTTYLLRVRSRDVYSNSGSSNNNGAGYSFTTTGGPAISAVAVTEVTDRTATITWNTDKDSSSLVFYSTNSTLTNPVQAGSSALVGGAGPVYSHSVTITGLNQETKYYFKVRSVDVDTNIGEDTNSGNYFYFNTTRDTAPPVFSNISPVLITSDSVVIGWQTNKKSTTQVAYGSVMGVYPHVTTVDEAMTINHNAALQGLTESTPYFYVVASVDPNGNAATSTEQTFTTNAVTVVTKTAAYCPASTLAALAEEAAGVKDTTPPTVSNVKVEPASLSAKVTLTTSEPASVFVQYGEDITNGYPSIQGNFDYLASHDITLQGLKMGTTYHYSIKAKDQAGNLVNTPDATFTTQFLSEPSATQQIEDQSVFRQKIENILESALPSLSPPFLSEPRVTSVTSDSATIEWDTNIAASSLVAFAPSDAYLPTATNPYIGELGSAQERVKNHKVELINLDSATTYHAQAVSQGVVGPFGKSEDFTFITKPSVPEVSILDVGPNRISVGWKTNSLTSSFVEYRNLKTGELATKGTDDLTREHVVTLEELKPNTRYDLKVFGRDSKGNRTESVSRIVSTVVDVTPPKLINVKINNALVPGRTDRLQTIVSWQTDELADSQVFYGEGAAVGEALKSKTSLDPVLTTDHTAVISSLKPGTVYRFRVVSVDQVGNKAESPIQVILTPQQAESIIDVISTNLEQSFGWIKLIQK